MIDKVCISVNAQCNLACKYCHFYNNESLANMEYAQGFSKKELSIILGNILYYADKNQIPKFTIGFAGGGEPLLSWNIISSALDDIYDKDDNKRLYFYIITIRNTKQHIKRLWTILKATISHLIKCQISIYLWEKWHTVERKLF